MWTHGMGFPKGSNLKPAWEPVILARKKGSGKLNINDCRVPLADGEDAEWLTSEQLRWKKADYGGFGGDTRVYGDDRPTRHSNKVYDAADGRHPANLIHDGSDEVLGLFPYGMSSKRGTYTNGGATFNVIGKVTDENSYDDAGSASRFFYCAKATQAEREAANGHPTIKPLKLMRYLVKLISNEGDVVLDPFMGSGSSIVAARLESRNAIGIDIDQAYCDTALERCDAAISGTLIDMFE